MSLINIRPPFTMEPTTHAPVHKMGCDICKSYMLHVAEASTHYALELYFTQKAEDYRQRRQADVDAAYTRGRKDATFSYEEDIASVRQECEDVRQQLATALEKIGRLRDELAEVKPSPLPSIVQSAEQADDVDVEVQMGSEIASNSFAAIAWASEASEGLRLYLNHNNVLTELCATEGNDYTGGPKPTWQKRFVFPGEILPNSAIAVAESFVSKQIIPDPYPPTDEDAIYNGRDTIRVFYFDTNKSLGEWIYHQSTGWHRSDLNITGADTKKIGAVCWVEGRRASWALFYCVTEGYGQQRGIFEIRCIGGSSGWSDKKLITSSYFGVPKSGCLQAGLFALNAGSRPFLYYTGYSRPGDHQLNSYNLNGSSNSLTGFTLSKADLCFSGLHLRNGGLHVWVQIGDAIEQWVAAGSGILRKGRVGSNNSSPATPLSAVVKNDRVYLFSLCNGKIVQSTPHGTEWSCHPIVVQNL